jgi:hypothetical protein
VILPPLVFPGSSFIQSVSQSACVIIILMFFSHLKENLSVKHLEEVSFGQMLWCPSIHFSSSNCWFGAMTFGMMTHCRITLNKIIIYLQLLATYLRQLVTYLRTVISCLFTYGH